MKKVSVIVPTYNSWRSLNNCLKSLVKQSLKPSEIIVVDNASPDETVKNVKKYFKKVKIVGLKTNTGVTGGRNTGIKYASKSSDYYFFFDHDMIADAKMLEELTKTAEESNEVGIVTPKIYYLSDKKRIWSAGTGINLITGQVLFRGGPDRGQYNKIEEVAVAPAALLVRKSVMNQLKEFDKRYFAVYEDTDFCFRAKKLGFSVMYTPHALAYHDLSEDSSKESQRLLGRGYWVGRNRVLFMKDYSVNFALFCLFLPIFIIHYCKLALQMKNLSGWVNFLRGTWDGLFSK